MVVARCHGRKRDEPAASKRLKRNKVVRGLASKVMGPAVLV